ncbi:MAG: Rrf2 family transcriptional regulator [Bdellovibrionota bacterium]
MRITRWSEYGILFSIFLARRYKGAAVGASEISDAMNVTTEYAQQILQKLRKGGIVDSVRGPKGGYKLSRQSESINLKEIITATEGDTFDVICENKPISDKCAENKNDCGLHSIWQDLKKSIDQFLENITLAQLAKEQILEQNLLVNIKLKATEVCD